MSRLGLHDDQLPCLLPATFAAGPLRQAAADALGLPAGIPVSPAIHDQYAASLGAVCVHDGDISLGAGTAWVLLVNCRMLSPPIVPDAFVCPHPLDGLHGQMLSMKNGGSAIAWVLTLLGDQAADAERIDRAIDAVPPGCDGLRFWPWLSGGPAINGLPEIGGRLAGISFGRNTWNHGFPSGLSTPIHMSASRKFLA
jgi:sugar (pentulose or hexulose) kinase